MSSAGAGVYIDYREEKQLAGERRGKPVHKRQFYLIDNDRQNHLVATGEDTGSGDGHYVYRGSHPGMQPISCTSRRKLTDWIKGILSAQPQQAVQVNSVPPMPLSSALTPAVAPGQALVQATFTQMPAAAAGQAEPMTSEQAAVLPNASDQLEFLGAVQQMGQMPQKPYRTFKRDRFRGDDGLRRIHYYLICHNDEQLLAVDAKEIKSSGGHYAYHAAPAFAPRVWKNGGDVRRWLASLCTHPDPVLTPASRQTHASALASAWPSQDGHADMAGEGLIRDPERRRTLINSTLADVQSKLDVLRRRAGVECTLTLVGLDDSVRVLTTAGVSPAATGAAARRDGVPAGPQPVHDHTDAVVASHSSPAQGAPAGHGTPPQQQYASPIGQQPPASAAKTGALMESPPAAPPAAAHMPEPPSRDSPEITTANPQAAALPEAADI